MRWWLGTGRFGRVKLAPSRLRWVLGLPVLVAALIAIALGPFDQRTATQIGPGHDAAGGTSVELTGAAHPITLGAAGGVQLLVNRGGGWTASPIAAVLRSGGWLAAPNSRGTRHPITDGHRLAGRGDIDQGRGPPVVDQSSVS